MKLTSFGSVVVAVSLFVSALRGQGNTFPSSGSVGIGTLSPAETLEVHGTIRHNHEYSTIVTFADGWAAGDYIDVVEAQPGAAGAAGDWEIAISYTRGNVASHSTHRAATVHASSVVWREAAMVTNNSYVGGTPAFVVDVNGNGYYPRFRVRAIKSGADTGVAGSNLGVHFRVRSIGRNAQWTALGTSGSGGTVMGVQSMTQSYRLYAGPPRLAAGSLALAVDESSNIGIGAAATSDRLTVGTDSADSNVRVGQWVYLGQESSHLTTVLGGNARAKGSSTVVATSTADGYRAIRMRYDQGITFHSYLGSVTADSVIGHERMRIDTGGNVGIGTTSPTHKLSVNGTIRAKEIIVDSGWADYVFADNYHLAPLDEVEAHIKEHRHLPGIPSAAEVAEQGVSLGEMQSRLLAKVEELTLHLIEQDRRAHEQGRRLVEQQKEIESLRALLTADRRTQ